MSSTRPVRAAWILSTIWYLSSRFRIDSFSRSWSKMPGRLSTSELICVTSVGTIRATNPATSSANPPNTSAIAKPRRMPPRSNRDTIGSSPMARKIATTIVSSGPLTLAAPWNRV